MTTTMVFGANRYTTSSVDAAPPGVNSHRAPLEHASDSPEARRRAHGACLHGVAAPPFTCPSPRRSPLATMTRVADTHHLSQATYDRLKAELEELTTVGRVEI